MKIRLQITSRPILDELDAEKVATGILDPALALKDPRLNYLKKSNGGEVNFQKYVWAQDTIEMMSPDDENKPAGVIIYTNSIYRMFRLKRKSSQNEDKDEEYWVFYTRPSSLGRAGAEKAGKKTGEITRVGPFKLRANLIDKEIIGIDCAPEQQCTPISLKDIEDLIFSKPAK